MESSTTGAPRQKTASRPVISSLHIENYVLIDSLDVEFPEGLIIITGQTGAGKSILLGALSLLLGAKADPSHISSGADSCVVEAVFDVDDNGDVREMLEGNDIEWDGGHLIVRRVLNRSGRSRSFVNDSPVQAALLSQLSLRLVDIHSQHQSLLLSDRKYQLSIIDSYAGVPELAGSCRVLWTEMHRLEDEIAGLRQRLLRANEDVEYNSAKLKRLTAAALREGELEDLEEEQKLLANSEEIKMELSKAAGLRPDALLKDAVRYMEKASRYMPSLSELSSRIDSARIELADVFDELENKAESIEFSEDRLMMIEDRLSLLYGLLKSNNCVTVSELIAVRDSLAAELGDSSELEDSIADKEMELEKAREQYNAICRQLHAGREKAAHSFSDEVVRSLAYLELDRAIFRVELSESQPGPSGTDMVIFKFSSTGADPVEVSKCASGGEISRIMLCLKAMMAGISGRPTMIFDEIDTGVSGSVADRMGSMICSMGRTMQVIAITHLPQVAAKGNAHFVVRKNVLPDGTAVSTLNEVKGDDRVGELARLLSGTSVTPQAVENAKALLNAD